MRNRCLHIFVRFPGEAYATKCQKHMRGTAQQQKHLVRLVHDVGRVKGAMMERGRTVQTRVALRNRGSSIHRKRKSLYEGGTGRSQYSSIARKSKPVKSNQLRVYVLSTGTKTMTARNATQTQHKTGVQKEKNGRDEREKKYLRNEKNRAQPTRFLTNANDRS